jgi:Uma2 family endonuclease
MEPATASPSVRPYRWTRAQYDRVIDVGGFGPEDRIELLDGELWAMTPPGTRHAAITGHVRERLRDVFGKEFHVRDQAPIALDDVSEPQPDLAVVPGKPLDYLEEHPAVPLLIVEVSKSSLSFDRGRKLAAYARNGIPEYWIVDLTANTLEEYRDPEGDRYDSKRVLRGGDTVTPLHAPNATIPVADLLP